MDVKRDLHAALPRTERQKRREPQGSFLEIIERTGDMAKPKERAFNGLEESWSLSGYSAGAASESMSPARR
jgi:hypothetical protein